LAFTTILLLTDPQSSITDHRIVSREHWAAERKKLLARERELTHCHTQT